MKGFIIAGTHSGVGKTTITLGLMSVIRKRGMIVQPFKAGPDYIDPSFHKLVCGRPSYNLDTWIMGMKGVRAAFTDASKDADISIVEGVMGLFDGHAGCKGSGSTAHIAKILGLPVILVIDAGKMAQSAGALVYGFERFDPNVNGAGVIFNRIGSVRHFEMIQTAVENRCKARVLGYMPKDEEINLSERHLGLEMPDSRLKTQDSRLKKLEGLIERFVDVDGILKISSKFKVQSSKFLKLKTQNSQLKTCIAVAMDNAFCFYYQENLDILKKLGAELKFFSPLGDKRLPANIDGIYLGGGYPELFAEKLSENKSLMSQIKTLAQKGLPIYAECGGLMYLGKCLKDLNGKRYNMTGVFPWTSRMLKRRKAIGYREVLIQNDCPFLENGEKVRGHEFHYSEIDEPPRSIKRVYQFTVHSAQFTGKEGYLYKNTLASYIHLHFASSPKFAKGFIKKCKEYRDANTD
ncbi:MAG: cobyrinate a,c-diamide synthase [Deltaproteobacteria bacterium]|nr:cobyrinate a,c-diamide synthase [Deltaproteobacteria bacterium]